MTRNSVLVTALTALTMTAAVVYGVFWLLGQSLPSDGSTPVETPVGGDPEPLNPVTGTDPVAQVEPLEIAGRLQIQLYVLDASGKTLTSVTQEILVDNSVQEQAKQVTRLLLRRSGAIPTGVSLRDLFISPQGVAYVDLSPEFVSNHPGGSSAEMLSVYSLSTTLVANFPAIQMVKILVDGREVRTLAGHLDLSIPYGRMPDTQPSGD